MRYATSASPKERNASIAWLAWFLFAWRGASHRAGLLRVGARRLQRRCLRARRGWSRLSVDAAGGGHRICRRPGLAAAPRKLPPTTSPWNMAFFRTRRSSCLPSFVVLIVCGTVISSSLLCPVGAGSLIPTFRQAPPEALPARAVHHRGRPGIVSPSGWLVCATRIEKRARKPERKQGICPGIQGPVRIQAPQPNPARS